VRRGVRKMGKHNFQILKGGKEMQLEEGRKIFQYPSAKPKRENDPGETQKIRKCKKGS